MSLFRACAKHFQRKVQRKISAVGPRRCRPDFIVLTRIEKPGGTPRDPERPGLVPAMRLLFRPLNVGSVSPSNPAEELSLDPVAPEEPVSLLRARVARGLGLAGGAADVAKILFRGKALQGECQFEAFHVLYSIWGYLNVFLGVFMYCMAKYQACRTVGSVLDRMLFIVYYLFPELF